MENLKRLPNFLIVGAQKAGTTSLHDVLAYHPQANMSRVKEINFFTHQTKMNKGLEYYSSFFEQTSNNQEAVGESSPGYMCYPNVPNLIKDKLGPVKIVMILRDPIKRAFSQYWDNRRHLSEYLNEKQIVEKCLTENYKPGMRGYFSRGVYIKYIEHYRKLFGDNNIHVIILEDLIQTPNKHLRELYHFLGINEDKGLQKMPKPSNASKIWKNPFYLFLFNNPSYTAYLPKKARRLFFWGPQERFNYKLPSQELINDLIQFYKPWNKELENYLQKDLSFWHK